MVTTIVVNPLAVRACPMVLAALVWCWADTILKPRTIPSTPPTREPAPSSFQAQIPDLNPIGSALSPSKSIPREITALIGGGFGMHPNDQKPFYETEEVPSVGKRVLLMKIPSISYSNGKWPLLFAKNAFGINPA